MAIIPKVNGGVYFLGEDRLIDLVIAFLNSFRKHNPSTALCLIPYNSNIAQLKQLQQKYHFSIYSNMEVLARCDDISLRFDGKMNGTYRKLAAWHGDFEQFIYIDVDTIILESVDFVFKYLVEYDFIASHSNIPHIRKYVWKDSIDAANHLTVQQISYSANTGFIASEKGALDLQTTEKKLDTAIALSKHMQMQYKEQPLINYLIVTSGAPYTSLSVLYNQKDQYDIKLELWAGTKGLKVKDGKVYGVVAKQGLSNDHRNAHLIWKELIKNEYIDSNGVIQARFRKLNNSSKMVLSEIPDEQKEQAYVILQQAFYTQGKNPPVLLMHWAGQWQFRFFDRIVFFILKLLGVKKKTDEPRMCFFMPYKKLWEYYRYKQV